MYTIRHLHAIEDRTLGSPTCNPGRFLYEFSSLINRGRNELHKFFVNVNVIYIRFAIDCTNSQGGDRPRSMNVTVSHTRPTHTLHTLTHTHTYIYTHSNLLWTWTMTTRPCHPPLRWPAAAGTACRWYWWDGAWGCASPPPHTRGSDPPPPPRWWSRTALALCSKEKHRYTIIITLDCNVQALPVA